MEDQIKALPKQKKEPSPFEPKGLTGSVYTVAHDVACLLAAITVTFILLLRLVGVTGSSMYPTLVGGQDYAGTKGDYLLLRSNFLRADYAQGDIVVACVPSFEDGKPIVKRVVATGGQTVSFRQGEDGWLHVYVDDVLQSEEHIREPMEARGQVGDGYSATVPEGCYFLMGDNRNNSTDSRYPDVGMVDGRYIVGKALWLVLPGQDSLKGNAADWSRIGDIYD